MPVSMTTERASSRGPVNGSLPDQTEKGEDFYYGSYSRQGSSIFTVLEGEGRGGLRIVKICGSFVKILQP